jgi:hypothetical protein
LLGVVSDKAGNRVEGVRVEIVSICQNFVDFENGNPPPKTLCVVKSDSQGLFEAEYSQSPSASDELIEARARHVTSSHEELAASRYCFVNRFADVLALRLHAVKRLRGRVVVTDGTPCPNARLSVTKISDMEELLASLDVKDVFPALGRTDENGDFELFVKRGANVKCTLTATVMDPSGARQTSDPLPLDPNDEYVEIRLRPWTGVVKIDTVDALTGSPLPNCQFNVVLQEPQEPAGAWQISKRRTLDLLTERIRAIPYEPTKGAPFRVVASHEGFMDSSTDVLMGDGRQDFGPITLPLHRAITIRGRVALSAGKGTMAGVKLLLVRVSSLGPLEKTNEPGPWKFSEPGMLGETAPLTAFTAADGSFVYRDVQAGHFEIRLDDTWLSLDEVTRLDVAPGHEVPYLDVRVQWAGTVSGYVICDGKFRSNPRVTLERNGKTVDQVELESRVTFQFRGLRPGPYRVKAESTTATGHSASVHEDVLVESGGYASPTLTLHSRD